MSDKLNICKNHSQPFMYSGDACPWCSFAAEVVTKLQAEYRRGFEDGVKAADIENAKHPLIKYIIKEEAQNGTGRISDPLVRGIQDGVQSGGVQEGGGVEAGNKPVESTDIGTKAEAK
jgi:glutaredoxin